MSGGSIEVPSNGLDCTNIGVMGDDVDALLSRLSSSIKAENRICRPAVPLTEATLPASVLISYVFAPAAVDSIAAALNARMGLSRTDFMSSPQCVLGWRPGAS